MWKLLVTLMLGFLMIQPLQAGRHTGEVKEILIGRGGNQLYIKLTNSPEGFACSSNAHPNGWQWSIDLNNVDDAVISALFMAKATNATIFIQGAGNCAEWHAGLENVGYIIIK